VAISEVWAKGGEGGIALAEELLRLIEQNEGKDQKLSFAYELDIPIKEKIRAISQKIYGADDVVFTDKAAKEIDNFEKLGYGNLPVCMAKTQYSLSDDPKKLGRPTGFNITVRDVTLSAGAGFLVAVTGDIMKMPGLPKVPAAEKIDVDEKGVISGLF